MRNLLVLVLVVAAGVLLVVRPRVGLDRSWARVRLARLKGRGKAAWSTRRESPWMKRAAKCMSLDRVKPHERVERFKPNGTGGYEFVRRST